MSTTATDLKSGFAWKWPIFCLCLVALVVSYLGMPAYDTVRDEVGYMLRVTARIAFVFLMLAYVARPLRVAFKLSISGIGAWLVRERRYLGLSMALAHTVHFGYVVALVVITPEPLALITLVFGGLAFVLMWAMAATSNNLSMRKLGKNWKRLHTTGLHYLWVIFMQSFLGRLGENDPYYIYATLFSLGIAGLLLRIWVFWQKRLAG